MIKIIHDASNTMFRNPTGARQAGFPIRLTLLTEQSLQGLQPVLHACFDKDDSRQELPMQQAPLPGTDGSAAGSAAGSVAGSDLYTAWSVSFVPESAGLYWYWFELVDAPADLPNTHQDPQTDPEDEEGWRGWREGMDNGWDAPVQKYEGPSFVGCDMSGGQAVLTYEPMAWQITVFEPVYEEPDWIRGGVFYHVFVDRFARSGDPVPMKGKILRDDWGGMPEWRPDEHGEILNNDFFGGNLEGVREKLPYFQELGVTCLYLSPIFEAYSSHKYDTSDYMKVDPMFGDNEGFSRLCAEAAERGIRIICDGVFSHTGSDSRYFDIHDRYGDGACHHPDSPYRDWYYFENGGWQSWWGISTLPRVNKNVLSYQKFMAGENGVIRKWLRAGASGWRLDVVDELPREFLEKLTAAAKAEKADALMLGEVWEDASNKVAYEERKNYFEGDKLDSVMNYPLRRGIIDYVRNGDAQALAWPMAMIMEHYPSRVVHALMNILGTHDTERIITALAGQKLGPDASREVKASIKMDPVQWASGIRRLKVAVVLQMTLPGVPCIYYGDEAGMEGYNDPFNRRCFPWGSENKDLQDWYRKVIAIRSSHAVYIDGDYRLLVARDGFFSFERFLPDAEITPASISRNKNTARLITAANCGQSQHVLPLHGSWRDLLSGAIFEDDIIVLPGQAMILEAR